jgi:hypothetical protein
MNSLHIGGNISAEACRFWNCPRIVRVRTPNLQRVEPLIPAVACSVAIDQISLSNGGRDALYDVAGGFQGLSVSLHGQEDLIVGSPIANRHRHELERLIGFFVNTLAMRTNLSGNPTFRESIKAGPRDGLSAYAHQDLPFEYLVRQLHPNRDLSHSPLVQVVFVLQNTPERKGAAFGPRGHHRLSIRPKRQSSI